MTPGEWGKLAQKIRVPSGMVLGVVFLLFMHPSHRSLWVGGAVALAGAALRVWAAGHIEKGKILAQGGPYAATRNPLYLGSLLMASGVFIAGQSYWLSLVFVVFYVALYFPVMKAEEQELRQKFGAGFEEYASRVPFFVPSFGSMAGASSTFMWSRVIRNGEHRTLAGLLLIELFLIIRVL